MAMRPPLTRLEPRRRLRRLTAFGLTAALALTGETLALVQPASADATYASRDAVTPVASYNFDNDSGKTVVDGSGHANNGTWSGTPAYAAGVSGKALHVSAGTNFVSLPKVAGQTDGSGSFSFETWWYDNTETADAPLVSNQNFASCGNAGFSFYHLSGTYQQRSCFAVNGTKTYSTTDTTSIRNGWHYLAVVEDAGAHTFSSYVDGTLFSTTSTISGTTAANFNSGDPIRIAQDGTGAYSATDDALVDDFNFYNQAIGADQIAADYAATNPATHFPVTVTDDGHGTGTATVLAPAAGDADSLVATPAAGYTFAGWVPVTPSTLAIDGNGGFVDPGTPVTVEATFTPNTYTVKYDGNGADGGSTASQTFTYGQSATLTPNGFTNSGEQFIGWATTPDGAAAYTDGQSVSDLTAAANGTVTLYARWAPSGSFSVTTTGDSHVTVSSSADATDGWVAPGATVTLTATPSTGYNSAWEAVSPAGLAIAADGTFTMPSQNVSVKAVSSPDTYTAAFNGNGATGGSMAGEPFTFDHSAALTANAFTRDGYAFIGWASTPSGTPTYTDGQSVSNLTTANGGTVTLYAVWDRYRAAGDTAAPVASYDFDDQGSTVTDSSGWGDNATWNGTATYAKGGLSGYAAHLSSGTTYIQLPLAAGRIDGSGSFSFSLWWGEYSETVDAPIVSNQDFAACYNAGLSFYHVSGTSTTRACWGQPTGSTRQYSATDPTSLTGNWHYLTVVVDRSAQTVSYYVDGALFTTSTSGQVAAGTNFASGLPFMIGQDGTGVYSASSDALVDDFDFYNQAISATQIANDYNATKPASTALPAESTVDVATPVATLSNGFVSDTFHAAQVRVGGSVSQPLAGLWNGNAVTSYTKVGGDSWLNVNASGVVSGTAPSSVPQHPGTITVQATDGTTTSKITVEVPVIAANDAPQVAAATWNLWDDGTHVDQAQLKNLAVIAENGLDVIGVQQDGGTGASQLAQALGWYYYEGSNGVGIVSAYPISSSGAVNSTDAAPAVGVTVDVAGRNVRVWDAALDEADYGPQLACTQSGADAASIVAAEKTTTRYAQAQAVAAEIQPDVAAAGTTPVVFLGDLESPSADDWTAATASSHCNIGAVDWPVPDVITGTGLTDSSAGTGVTWPIVSSDTDTTTPQDRIDYVDYAGSDLHVLGSNTLVAGWPTSDAINANAWTSDHAAVVTTFRLGDAVTPTQSAPTVTVAHDRFTYQAGHGPADASVLAAAIGVTSDPADASISVAGDVDYSTVGYYTVLVTATENGYVSDPVAVVVQVVPVATVKLTNSSVSVNGLGLNQAEVLDGLGASLSVNGVVNVDLSTVNKAVAGSYPVTVTGTDDYGFTATAQATVVISTPDLPPVVTATVDPGSADGSAGWYVSTPIISASVTDDEGTTPTIQYRIGDGGWTAYTGPLTVAEGSWTYQFRATDDYDQVSDTVTVPVHVDTVAPYTTATATPGATIIAPVTVTLAAADATSGVAKTEYQIGDGGWTAYTGPFPVTPEFSDQTVLFRSTDAAGNVEATRQLVVPAITPIAPTVTAPNATAPYGTAAKVSVSVSSPGLPADGTVALTEGTTARGTATLSGGVASFTLPIGLAAGTHTLVATYSGSDLLTAASRTLTVTVTLPQAWDAKTAYTTGAQVGYQGRMYVAAWYAQGQVPGADPNGPWQEISMTESGTAVWTASRIFNTGDVVEYNGATYTAAWYSRDQIPGDPTGPWEQIGTPGAGGIASWTSSMIYNTGDKVVYQGVTYQAQWYNRDVAPGGKNSPWKVVG